MAKKSGNVFKGEVNEQGTGSTPYPKKNYKLKFQKRKKKEDKLSLARQAERQHQPIPKGVEEWGGHRGLIEYQMGKDIAEDILSLRKGKEKGIDPQKWLCDYINEQEHLIGYCIKVVIAG